MRHVSQSFTTRWQALSLNRRLLLAGTAALIIGAPQLMFEAKAVLTAVPPAINAVGPKVVAPAAIWVIDHVDLPVARRLGSIADSYTLRAKQVRQLLEEVATR